MSDSNQNPAEISFGAVSVLKMQQPPGAPPHSTASVDVEYDSETQSVYEALPNGTEQLSALPEGAPANTLPGLHYQFILHKIQGQNAPAPQTLPISLAPFIVGDKYSGMVTIHYTENEVKKKKSTVVIYDDPDPDKE